MSDPIQVISYTFGDRDWKGYSPVELFAIEAELLPSSLADAIRAYWRRNNPPTKVEQMHKFGGIRTPGDELIFLEGVKLPDLSTVSGRKKASGIFRRNTHNFVRRANEETKRFQ